jgi:RHS repeat-associated protein
VTAVVKGTRRSEFFYDGVGRRVRMVEREGATTVSDRRYIWDGGEIVEERDGANTSVVTKRYFGAGVQEVAANATTNLFYSRDHLGSVREVTDANGNLVARYDYDPWGRQTQMLGTYKADWGYAGYFVHRASKLNLTWYRAYDPDLGRWVSRDPIEEDGGLNLYGYIGNNPLNSNDPDGLAPKDRRYGYSKDFWNWVERIWKKRNGRGPADNLSKEEAEEAHQEWEDEGSPKRSGGHPHRERGKRRRDETQECRAPQPVHCHQGWCFQPRPRQVWEYKFPDRGPVRPGDDPNRIMPILLGFPILLGGALLITSTGGAGGAVLLPVLVP